VARDRNDVAVGRRVDRSLDARVALGHAQRVAGRGLRAEAEDEEGEDECSDGGGSQPGAPDRAALPGEPPFDAPDRAR
jgi:hypothetical protein